MLSSYAENLISSVEPAPIQGAPLWLSATASARGARLGSGADGYSWCEFGCGSGLGAVINAAANPKARLIAIDPDARLVAQGRRLAEAAAINNVIFLCAPLESLALDDCRRGPLHDFIVYDSRLAAANPDSAAALDRCLARWLKPGGLRIDLYEPAEYAESSVRLLASENPAAQPPNVATLDRCRRLNRLICEQALNGAGYTHLAAPALGAALPADRLQMAAMQVLLECPGVEGELLQEMVRIVLDGAGIAMQPRIERKLQCFERLVLPHWCRLGMLASID